ncbi:MAG TPA: type II secretion system protein [Candidatus Saccharimonadales bacterium]|nr:type II secretion system protein [Candidatus Saccharimonadales bacterium]
MSVKKQNNKGFTIIEVLIVLAIAGVIMLVVFLAVPSLQRNSRNTQRKSDVSHLAGLINEYESNNAGSPPTAIATGNCTTSGTSCTATAGTMYLGSDKFSLETIGDTTLTTIPSTMPTSDNTDTMYVYTKATCNGNSPVVGTSNRDLVIYYFSEGSGGNVGQCSSV